MFFREKDFPLDAEFDEREFENIFLHNAYPGEKRAAKAAGAADKAEVWALFDAQPAYNGLNLVRRLRQLWGIHLVLRIGARSATNKAVRGLTRVAAPGQKVQSVYFEGYQGNISDATRSIVSVSPYDNLDKSRALSQKSFVRLVVPLKGLSPIERIESVLMAYSIVFLMDRRRFAGIVDPDLFLFVPPGAVHAGLAHFHRSERLLNTHLVAGFNFFTSEERTRFFTHGLNRFGMSDLLVMEAKKDQPLKAEQYTEILKRVHSLFLTYLTAPARTKIGGKPLLKSEKLPEQVAAMVGKKLLVQTYP